MIGFVINPLSGNGKGASVWAQVRSVLIDKGIEHVYAVSTQPGETAALAARLVGQHSLSSLIAVGGDGTVHEVACGLWGGQPQGPECSLGLIPAGTGNDFAKAHGIPLEPEEALAFILSGIQHRALDLLRLPNRVAVNSIGAGFDGMVAKLANESRIKKLLNRVGLGKLSYFFTMLRVLWTYQPCQAELIVDGHAYTLPHTWLIAATNIPFYGGSMQICPHAIPHDGVVDVMVIRSRGRLKLLPIMFSVYAGKHTNHPAVSFYQGKRIEIRSALPLAVQADGEPAGHTPVSLEVVPLAYRLIGGQAAPSPGLAP